jgi:hypothetical protein
MNMNIDREEYLRYLENRMSEAERNAFEKKLQADPFSMEALEGLEDLQARELKQDLDVLQAKLSARTGKKLNTTPARIHFYRIAAAVAILIATGSVLVSLLLRNPEKLQRRIADSELPVSEDRKTGETAGREQSIVEKRQRTEESAPDSNQLQKGEEKSTKRTETAIRVKDQPVISEEQEEVAQMAEETAGQTESRTLDKIVAEESPPEEEIETLKVEPSLQEVPAARSELRLASKSAAPAVAVSEPDDSFAAGLRLLRGKVLSSEDNQPLPGAVLVLKGTNIGTVADLQGNFSMEVPDREKEILVANFIGMESGEVAVGNQSEYTITLNPDIIALDEVVVVGYAPERKASLTGAVSTIEIPKENETSGYQEAEPLTGYPEFQKYIKENIHFPEGETGPERGIVVLSFDIPLDGKPQNITVLKSPGDPFTEEAIRLIREGPSWNPAQMNGKAFKSSKRIRIVFTK